jgi:RNA recognition motif-containing protein
VKNLPYDITEETIRDVFEKYGKITQVRMVYDAYHKHFKGFCYIEYASPSSLKGGLKMNGVEYHGRKLVAVLIVPFSNFPRKGPVKATNHISKAMRNDY